MQDVQTSKQQTSIETCKAAAKWVQTAIQSLVARNRHQAQQTTLLVYDQYEGFFMVTGGAARGFATRFAAISAKV